MANGANIFNLHFAKLAKILSFPLLVDGKLEEQKEEMWHVCGSFMAASLAPIPSASVRRLSCVCVCIKERRKACCDAVAELHRIRMDGIRISSDG